MANPIPFDDVLKEVAAIEAEAEKASPGPWRVGHPNILDGQSLNTWTDYWFYDISVDRQYRDDSDARDGRICGGEWSRDFRGVQYEQDSHFIASARTNVPRLCATIRELLERVRIAELPRDGDMFARGPDD